MAYIESGRLQVQPPCIYTYNLPHVIQFYTFRPSISDSSMATTAQGSQGPRQHYGMSTEVLPGGYAINGPDYREYPDASHINRDLSFRRQYSLRQFKLDPRYAPVSRKHSLRRNVSLQRKNAVRLSPLQFLKHVWNTFMMRLRTRRRARVVFPGRTSCYITPETSVIRYKVKTRDLFRRKPKLRSMAISKPICVAQGQAALNIAEQAKNIRFDTRIPENSNSRKVASIPNLRKRELPRRSSQREQVQRRAPMMLPTAPELDEPSFEGGEARRPSGSTVYEDLGEVPDLVQASSTRSKRSHRQKTHYAPIPREQPETEVNIDDALDFVNSWGAYLQRVVAERTVKEREVRLRELQEEARFARFDEEYSDSESMYSSEDAIHDSCTSGCFATTSSESESEDSDSLEGSSAGSDSDVPMQNPVLKALDQPQRFGSRLTEPPQQRAPLPPQAHSPPSPYGASPQSPPRARRELPKQSPKPRLAPLVTSKPLHSQGSPSRPRSHSSTTQQFMTPRHRKSQSGVSPLTTPLSVSTPPLRPPQKSPEKQGVQGRRVSSGVRRTSQPAPPVGYPRRNIDPEKERPTSLPPTLEQPEIPEKSAERSFLPYVVGNRSGRRVPSGPRPMVDTSQRTSRPKSVGASPVLTRDSDLSLPSTSRQTPPYLIRPSNQQELEGSVTPKSRHELRSQTNWAENQDSPPSVESVTLKRQNAILYDRTPNTSDDETSQLLF